MRKDKNVDSQSGCWSPRFHCWGFLIEEKRLDRAGSERIGGAFPDSGRDHQIHKAATGRGRVRAFGMAVEPGECPWGRSAALHRRIYFSADLRSRSDLADGLSWRCGGYAFTGWGSIVQSRFVSYVFGCGALAGVVLAGRPVTRGDSSAELTPL